MSHLNAHNHPQTKTRVEVADELGRLAASGKSLGTSKGNQ